MAEEPTMESGLVAKEAADEQAHPLWSATKDFLRPFNPIAGAANAIEHTIHPAPTDTPGENVIDQAAMGILHGAGHVLDRADHFSKAAQHSKTFGEWAGNTSQGLGNLLATPIPGIGPAAAHAGEVTGGNATSFLAGDDKKFVAPKPLKGLAQSAGLIGSVLVGGAKGRAASKYLNPILNKPVGRLFEGAMEEPAPTILPPGHAGEEAAQMATATAKPEVFDKFMGDWSARNAASNNAARLRAAHPPAIEAPYSDQLPADEISPLADWSTERSSKGPIPVDKAVDKYPVSLKYDEDGNITDLDGRHRVIQAIEDGQETIPVHTKLRDGSTSILQVDPKRVAQQFGVTKESLAATDAQQPFTRAGGGRPNNVQSIEDHDIGEEGFHDLLDKWGVGPEDVHQDPLSDSLDPENGIHLVDGKDAPANNFNLGELLDKGKPIKPIEMPEGAGPIDPKYQARINAYNESLKMPDTVEGIKNYKSPFDLSKMSPEEKFQHVQDITGATGEGLGSIVAKLDGTAPAPPMDKLVNNIIKANKIYNAVEPIQRMLGGLGLDAKKAFKHKAGDKKVEAENEEEEKKKNIVQQYIDDKVLHLKDNDQFFWNQGDKRRQERSSRGGEK